MNVRIKKVNTYKLRINKTEMKEYIKINLASPQKILKWTERCFPNGKLIGEVTKSMRKNIYKN